MSSLSSKNIGDLVRICRDIGKDIRLVQAGGGNVSVKSDTHLAVKASGIRLAQVTRRRGIARASRQSLLKGMATLGCVRAGMLRELEYVKLLGEAGTGKWRVSMEAGFHAAIPHVFVAHHHSLAGILLGMEPDAALKRLVRHEFGSRLKLVLLPPAVPGANLSLDLKKIAARSSAKIPLLAVLRSHGLVWAANSATEVLALSKRFEHVFRARYDIEEYAYPHAPGSKGCQRGRSRKIKGEREICFCAWKECRFDFESMFPDFTVYLKRAEMKRTSEVTVTLRGKDKKDLLSKEEVFYAHALVSTAATGKVRVKRLSKAIISSIRKLETERLRLKQAAKA